MGWLAVYEREMRLMLKKVGKLGYFLSAILFPLIYLFAFGWGFGGDIAISGGYLPFLAKGMLAITVLLNSFQQTALSVSLGRFYFRTLQTVLLSPVSAWQTVLGITLAGVTRGLIAGIAVYGIAVLAFAVPMLSISGFIGLVLAAFCFGALGIAVGLWVDNPDALSTVINCLIMPMTFFCGSFFPIEKLPMGIREAVSILPLSLTNVLLRAPVWSTEAVHAVFLLSFLTIVSIGFGYWRIKKYSE